MDIRFATKKVQRMAQDPDYHGGFGMPVVAGYQKVLGIIRLARDERDLRAAKSLRFEKLSGDRKGQHSLRINKQFRLIVTGGKMPTKVVVVVEIVDYH